MSDTPKVDEILAWGKDEGLTFADLVLLARDLERNATRYELLRSHVGQSFDGMFEISEWDATDNVMGNHLYFDSPEKLDAAIDAAIRASK